MRTIIGWLAALSLTVVLAVAWQQTSPPKKGTGLTCTKPANGVMKEKSK